MTSSTATRAIFLTGPTEGTGIRVAVKDCIDIAGETTAAGSRALAEQKPAERDAAVVKGLREAGFTIAGRVTMHELAYGVTGINTWTGSPINPFYPKLVPGGSSSGSAAAVASGLADISLGTDTGGSVRVPAACCGIVGFKPGFGRISRGGILPGESSLDCVGFMARSVGDIEYVLQTLIPDWETLPVPVKPSFGFIETFADIDIAAMTMSALEPNAKVARIHLHDLEAAQQAGLDIIGRECWDAYSPLLKSGLIGTDVADRLAEASRITDTQILDAEEVRTRFTAAVDFLLTQYDALALPTLPCAPPALCNATDAKQALPITALCRPFNLSGHPAIALPIGEIGGAPVSLQLVGRKDQEAALCALARAIPLFIKGDIT